MAFELSQSLLDELNEAVENNATEKVATLINGLHPADIAEILDEQTTEEAKKFYHFLPEELAADVLIELDEDTREKFLEVLTSQHIATHLIDNMDSDDAADVIGELSEKQQTEVLSHIGNAEQAKDISHLLNYPEDTAGGLMGKELIKVNLSWDIKTCLKELKAQAEEVEKVFTVYVVDDDNVLQGLISLRRILLTPNSKLVKDIYRKDIFYVTPDVEDQEVANIMDKYDLVSVPVVDENKKLLGRITIDDVVDVIKEDAEKDYQMASGISENIESSDKFWIISRARLPWLLVGMLGGITTSKIIGTFESQIRIHPEMAFFIPLIGAMGGNTGTQASALVVQGLANNSLGLKSGIWTQILKEMGVGLINGSVCSALVFLYNLFFSDNFSLTITVSVGLMSVIFFAGIFGTFVPMLLNKFKINPALATGPFISTTNDIFGTFLYFFIGHLMYAI